MYHRSKFALSESTKILIARVQILLMKRYILFEGITDYMYIAQSPGQVSIANVPSKQNVFTVGMTFEITDALLKLTIINFTNYNLLQP